MTTTTRGRRQTETELEQVYTEEDLEPYLTSEIKPLLKDLHTRYLLKNIKGSPESNQGLHCSRPWMVYWTLHAADILGCTDEIFQQTPRGSISEFLLMCLREDDPCVGKQRLDEERRAAAQKDNSGDVPNLSSTVTLSSGTTTGDSPSIYKGGFGGGPTHQIPHLATSYAAVCSFAILGLESRFNQIPRQAIQRWLVSLRSETTGSYRMHTGGETDVRATFCACVVATLLDLDLEILFPRKCLDYILLCQTHEGGIGCDAVGGTEAHGGYTQCGLAAAVLLRSMPHIQQSVQEERRQVLASSSSASAKPRTTRYRKPAGSFDMKRLRQWLGRRQRAEAGGFNGRTNKLVDSCYSFWIGSSNVMCEVLQAQEKLLMPTMETSKKEEGETSAQNEKMSSSANSNNNKPTLKEILCLDLGQMVDLNLTILDLEELAPPEHEAIIKDHTKTMQASAASTSSGSDTAISQTLSTLYGQSSCGAGEDAKGDNTPSYGNNATWFDLGSQPDVREGPASLSGDFNFNQVALQHYVVQCCQNTVKGGLMDKPDHPNDSYHTCYSLSGTTLATNNWLEQHRQHELVEEGVARGWLTTNEEESSDGTGGSVASFRLLANPEDQHGLAQLRATNPIFNLVKQRVAVMLRHFRGRSFL